MEKEERLTYGELAEAVKNEIIDIAKLLGVGSCDVAIRGIERFKNNYVEKYGEKNIEKAIELTNRLRFFSFGLMRETNMDISHVFDKKEIEASIIEIGRYKAELEKEIEE